MRWKLTLEYCGTRYAGWQRQGQGHRSIQQAVEEAIEKFSGRTIRLHGAGRTDSGVHAQGQVAHFDHEGREMSGYGMAKAINAFLLRESIAVVAAEQVAPDFHARFGAKTKLYTYSILNRPAKPALQENRVWHIGRRLDIDAMQRGANHLIGCHDFTSFRASLCQAKSPIRSIDRLDIGRSGDTIAIETEGRSFLHHQIRNIVGTLVLVGEGKWQPDDVAAALAAKTRAAGGITAPADGLCLTRIAYD